MITLVTILILISAWAKAVKDTIDHHYYTSVFSRLNPKFWNPIISWQNKYKDLETKKPKHFGSTTFLVWTTDAWHLFDLIQNTAWQLALAICISPSIYVGVMAFVGIKLTFSGTFHTLYKLLEK